MSTFTLDEYTDSEEGYERWLADRRVRRLDEVSALRERQKRLSDELAEVNGQTECLGSERWMKRPMPLPCFSTS